MTVLKILVVEDDSQISKSLKLNLTLSGYRVELAESVAQATQKTSAENYDLILLDIGLPDGNGLSFCKSLRTAGNQVPILFLSARTDEGSVVEGIKLGADDYIRKPFGTEELKARMQRILEKSGPKRKILEYGPLKLDVEKREVTYSGQAISLARREFDILGVMLKRAGDVTTRENILAALNDDGDLFDRTVDSHISHLRRKLRDSGCDKVQITAVYGVGYRLDAV